MVGNDNIELLVYLGAFVADEGDKVSELTTRFPGSSWRSYVHRIGRTSDDDRAGVHPLSRACQDRPRAP